MLRKGVPSSQAFSRLLFHLLKASNCSKKKARLHLDVQDVHSNSCRFLKRLFGVIQQKGRQNPGQEIFLADFQPPLITAQSLAGWGNRQDGGWRQMHWAAGRSAELCCTVMAERGERSRVSRLARPQYQYVAQSTEQLLERDNVSLYAFPCQWHPVGALAMGSGLVTCVQPQGWQQGAAPGPTLLPGIAASLLPWLLAPA